jgi:hypothetical protein
MSFLTDLTPGSAPPVVRGPSAAVPSAISFARTAAMVTLPVPRQKRKPVGLRGRCRSTLADADIAAPGRL